MRARRRLGLKCETLSQLTNGDMNVIVGGSHGCPTTGCETVTHGPSLDEACETPTLPVVVCVRSGGPLSCMAC